MRSHDRTLLAQLAYKDRDRSDMRHELACRYISDHSVFSRMMIGAVEVSDCSSRTAIESHLTKGEGRYLTTIGFVDVVGEAKFTKDDIWFHGLVIVEVKIAPESVSNIIKQIRLYETYGQAHWGRRLSERLEDIRWSSDKDEREEYQCAQQKSDEIVAQLTRPLVAVTDYDLTEGDVGTLNKARISHVRLGKNFDAYVQEQKSSQVAKSVEI